jgi:phosphoadenosine phosphosulfate reductase
LYFTKITPFNIRNTMTTIASLITSAEERLDFIQYWNDQLEPQSPEQILAWAVETFAPKLAMGTALGISGCLILSMIAERKLDVDVFNIDTGYQFPETLDVIIRIRDKYGIEIRRETPNTSAEEFERIHGGALHQIDSNRCCRERKIQVLERVAPRYTAWISGLRRDQGPTRLRTPVLGWDARFGLFKIAPLALWSGEMVWNRIVYESIPYNVLFDQGYTSIGCAPCTRPTLPGEDERAGRWSGQLKMECGLHLVNQSVTNAQL